MRSHKENPDGIFAAALVCPVCHGRGEKDWQKVYHPAALWQRTFYYASKKHEASLPATHSEIKVGRRVVDKHTKDVREIYQSASLVIESRLQQRRKHTAREDRKGVVNQYRDEKLPCTFTRVLGVRRL